MGVVLDAAALDPEPESGGQAGGVSAALQMYKSVMRTTGPAQQSNKGSSGKELIRLWLANTLLEPLEFHL